MTLRRALFACSILTIATSSLAQTNKPPAIHATCVESIPKGASRPQVRESFPAEAFTGYVANLELTVDHGQGETVLPNGFKLERSTEAYRALEKAGFAIAAGGPTEARIETKREGDRAITHVSIPLVLLPRVTGRVSLVLPPLPITVARASNETMTLCTSVHEILSQDPTGNESEPEVRPNAPARPQREDWPFLRNLVLGILLGVVVAVLTGYLLRKWLRQPKPAKVEPKELPWVVALRELEALRASTLLANGQKTEFYASVSATVRKYLGARYGFEALGLDGLDTTTDEMRTLLQRVWPPVPGLGGVTEFLQECDLVKFARFTPSESECLALFAKADGIIRTTKPEVRAADGPGQAGPRMASQAKRPSPPEARV